MSVDGPKKAQVGGYTNVRAGAVQTDVEQTVKANPAAGAAGAPKQGGWVATGAAAPVQRRAAMQPPDATPPFALGKNGGLSPAVPFERFLGMADPTEATLEAADPTLRDYFKTGQFGEFVGEGGKTIRYGVFGPPAGVPVKGVINISVGTRESMVKYAETLFNYRKERAEGYVIAIADHRGQGFSDKEVEGKLHIGSYGDFVKDQKTFRKQVLEKHFGNDVPYSLVGHSLGGAIGAKYVQDHPSDYKRLVMMSPMLDINTMIPSKAIEEGLVSRLAGARPNEYAPGQSGYEPNPDFGKNRNTTSAERFAFVARQFQRNPATQLDGVTNQWLHQGMELDKAILSAPAKLKAIDGGKGEVHMLLGNEDEVVENPAARNFASKLGIQPVEFRARHELLNAPDFDRRQVLNVLRKLVFR